MASVAALADSCSIRYVGVWGEQDNIVSGQHGAQDEYVRAISGHTSRREVDHGHHLTAGQPVALVSLGDLGARLFDADFTEIDLQLQSGIPCVSVGACAPYRANADIQVQELIQGGHD